MRHRLTGLLAAGLLLLPACAEGDLVQRQAQTGEDGMQATGRLGGSRVAISSGEPDVVRGDCDPGDGLDEDLCMVVRTIDGVTLNLVIENPRAMVVGETLTVRADPCVGEACDGVTEVAVVDLRVAGEEERATSGSLSPTVVGDRVAASFNLRFRDGDTLVGTFDVEVG